MGHSAKIISNGFAFPTEPTSPEANLAFSANDINARDVVHFRFLLPIICYAVQLDVDALPRSITFTWILNISALLLWSNNFSDFSISSHFPQGRKSNLLC